MQCDPTQHAASSMHGIHAERQEPRCKAIEREQRVGAQAPASQPCTAQCRVQHAAFSLTLHLRCTLRMHNKHGKAASQLAHASAGL